MGWVNSGDDRDSTIGELAELAAPFSALYAALWTQRHVPADILELCRLRLAQLHQCGVELQRHEIDIPAEKPEYLAHLPAKVDQSPASGASL